MVNTQLNDPDKLPRSAFDDLFDLFGEHYIAVIPIGRVEGSHRLPIIDVSLVSGRADPETRSLTIEEVSAVAHSPRVLKNIWHPADLKSCVRQFHRIDSGEQQSIRREAAGSSGRRDSPVVEQVLLGQLLEVRRGRAVVVVDAEMIATHRLIDDQDYVVLGPVVRMRRYRFSRPAIPGSPLPRTGDHRPHKRIE